MDEASVYSPVAASNIEIVLHRANIVPPWMFLLKGGWCLSAQYSGTPYSYTITPLGISSDDADADRAVEKGVLMRRYPGSSEKVES